MRVMEVPGEGNCRYFGFIDLQSSNVKLLPGEMMKSNFDPVDIESRRWTAKVIDASSRGSRRLYDCNFISPRES